MASVDVFCKICDSEEDLASSKLIVNGNRIINDDGASDFNFKEVFLRDAKVADIYSASFNDLTQYFLCNYNTSLILLGTRENLVPLFTRGKGTPRKEPILIDHIVEQLHNEFNRRSKSRQGRAQTGSTTKSVNTNKDDISTNVYEIIDNEIKDLIVMSESATSRISIIDNPEVTDDDFDGIHVKNLKSYEFGRTIVKELQIRVNNALNETHLQKLNGTSANPIIVEFILTKHIEGFDIPVTCWFRIIVVPYSKADDTIPMFHTVLNDASRGNTASTPSESRSHVLKKLLAEILGGNCITKSLLLLDHGINDVNKRLLKCVPLFEHIFNYPVDNLPHVKGLLSKLRSKIRHLDKIISKDKNVNDAFIEELKEQIQVLQFNNNEMRNEKTTLEDLYDDIKEKYSNLVESHSVVSSKNVLSMAEKLKMSKEAVELKMTTNKLQQEAEKQVFELKSKLLSAEEEKCKLERSLAYERKIHEDLKGKYTVLKKDNEDVSGEYINLKSNFESLNIGYQEQVQINNELNEAVKKLSFRKEQLSSEKSELEIQQIKEFNEQLQKLSLALSSSANSRQSSVSRFPAPNPLKPANNTVEHEDVEKLRENHFTELQSLEEKLFGLKKTLNANDEVISSYKQRLTQVTSKMLILQDNKELTDNHVLELETTLKNLSSEYRMRLEHYINDVKEFVQNNPLIIDKSVNQACITKMENMVSGLKECYVNTQQIHDKQINDLNSKYNHILNQHERVLIAYRLSLNRCEKTTNEIDEEISTYEALFPDTHEIKNFQTKERNEMRTKLCISEQRAKDLEEMVLSLKEKLKIQEETIVFKANITPGGGEGFPWSGIQKKIQDFSTNVQLNLEKEKAELLTRCLLAEQQLQDCQSDMNEGFQRYQQEIERLAQILSGYEQQLVHNVNMNAQPNINMNGPPNVIMNGPPNVGPPNVGVVQEANTGGFLPPIASYRPNYRAQYRR